MMSLDELKDDEEFSDLKEDVEEECKRFGKVVGMVIPRPQVLNDLVAFVNVSSLSISNSRMFCCVVGGRVCSGRWKHLRALQREI